MYALPRYNEVDPTPLLAPFYLVFFGMMVADMAYGLIMLIATSIVLKKANLEEDTRNFIKFFFYLSFSVIAWGALYGSFFGDLIPIKGFGRSSGTVSKHIDAIYILRFNPSILWFRYQRLHAY